MVRPLHTLFDVSHRRAPPPPRLCIWQQNLNTSDKAHYDLINSPLHKSWDVLALQEPYINSFSKTKANSQWHVIYPSPHLTNSAVNRSVILISASLDVNKWAQIPVDGTNDISTIQLFTPRGHISIFNLYVNCNHSEALEALGRTICNNCQCILGCPSDSIIWCGDFNRHHAMWDEERNHLLFMASAMLAANELISYIAEFGLVMTLPKGIPTLQAMATKNWTRVDNVFMSEDLAGLLICCDTTPNLRSPGTDHVPVHTIIDTGVPQIVPEPYRAYRVVDWKAFRKNLSWQLESIPGSQMIRSDSQFQCAVAELTGAIQATIAAVVPFVKLALHSRRWWNGELSALKKQLNRLNNQSYRFRALTDHPIHVEHREACNKYSEAIKRAKSTHWQEFLDSAQGADIWTANHYISNPTNDGGRQRILTLKVTQPDDSPAEVSTNEEKALVFHRCFFPPKPPTTSVPDSPDYPPRVRYKFRLTKSRLHRQISKLRPFKAPGEDGIPNVVLKESADLLVPYLLQIFRAVFKLDVYSNSWCTWNTIVLRKLGKARYDMPKAYRPIALMNTIGKLLSALVADDMSYMCEKYCLLPDTHFGGRPGKNTSNAMHYLVNKVKGA